MGDMADYFISQMDYPDDYEQKLYYRELEDRPRKERNEKKRFEGEGDIEDASGFIRCIEVSGIRIAKRYAHTEHIPVLNAGS